MSELRDQIHQAICNTDGLDHHPSEDDEVRITDTVMGVVEAEQERQRGFTKNIIESKVERAREEEAAFWKRWVRDEHDDLQRQLSESQARERGLYERLRSLEGEQ